MDYRIESIGGSCPMQAEGEVCGVPFYWRLRHGTWRFSAHADPLGFLDQPGWDGYYEEGDIEECAANNHGGEMPEADARRLIAECCERFIDLHQEKP